jgi:hypothetical protein
MNWLLDKILPHLFRHLPKRVLYWATVQAWALATTNPYKHQTPDETTFFQVSGWLYDGRVK